MLQYLQTLKLSVSQYLKISVAAIIGALVLVIKIQSDQLHVARVNLLKSSHAIAEQRAQVAVTTANQNTNKARLRYVQAINDYMAYKSASSK